MAEPRLLRNFVNGEDVESKDGRIADAVEARADDLVAAGRRTPASRWRSRAARGSARWSTRSGSSRRSSRARGQVGGRVDVRLHLMGAARAGRGAVEQQDDEVVQNEVFGTVITVQNLSDEDEALRWANGLEQATAAREAGPSGLGGGSRTARRGAVPVHDDVPGSRLLSTGPAPGVLAARGGASRCPGAPDRGFRSQNRPTLPPPSRLGGERRIRP